MHVATSPTELSDQRQSSLRWPGISSELISISVLTLVTMIFAWDRLHLDRQISSVDNPTFVIPMFAELGTRLRHGDIPGWLPSIFSGIPFAGDPQSGWMYLPAMVLFALLPVLTAFKAFVVVHLLIAGFSTYALSRLLGLGKLGSFTAAIAFEFAPLLKYTICCFPFPQITAWVPLSLLGIELAVRARTWPARGAGWSVVGLALSQELAGWIGQGAYYGLLAAGSYLVFRTLLSPYHGQPSIPMRFRDFAVHATGMYGFAFGLAAAGVLPRLDAVSRSTRAGGISATNNGEFNGLSVAQVIVRLLEVDRGQGRWYVGGSVIALAIVAPLIRQNAVVFYFLGFSVVTVVLTLDTTPVHQLFFLLPKFGVIHEHVPSRILIILWIGPAILAGTTIDALAQKTQSSRQAVGAVLAGVLLMLLGVAFVHNAGEHLNAAALWIIGLTAVVLLVTALLQTNWAIDQLPFASIAARGALVALLALLLWDTAGRTFGRVDDVLTPQAMAVAADASASSGAAEFLRARQAQSGPFRYFGYDTGKFAEDNWRGGYRVEFRDPGAQSILVNNRAIVLGFEDIQGYDPIQIGRYLDLITAINGHEQEYHELDIYPSGLSSPLLNLLNVRYIVVPAVVPPGRPDLLHLSQRYPTVFTDDQVRVLENEHALPRAWIVHAAQTVEKNSALELISSGSVDPAKTVLIERSPPELKVSVDSFQEEVTVNEDSGDRVRLSATAAAPGMIVINDTYDPDWKAYVDGKQVPLYVADHAIRAVPLPAGHHSVELRYDPVSLKVGMIVSAIAILLTLAIYITIVIGIVSKWRHLRRF